MAQFIEVQMEQLIEDPQNLRRYFDDTLTQELAANIRSHGVLQAILLEGPNAEGKYRIRDGHRRVLACRQLGIQKIPALVMDEQGDPTLTGLSISLHREGLTLFELGAGYHELQVSKNWTARQISLALAVSESSVSKALKTFRSLSPACRELLQAGKLDSSVAYHLARIPQHDAQLAIATQAAEKGWNVQEVAKAVRAHLNGEFKRPTQCQIVIDGVGTVQCPGELPAEQFLKQVQKWLQEARKSVRANQTIADWQQATA